MRKLDKFPALAIEWGAFFETNGFIDILKDKDVNGGKNYEICNWNINFMKLGAKEFLEIPQGDPSEKIIMYYLSAPSIKKVFTKIR